MKSIPRFESKLLVTILLGLFCEPAISARYLNEAQKDFVGREQGVVGVTYSTNSLDEDISFFEVDLDRDGRNEIFISRPDLIRDSLWVVYRDSLLNNEIEKIGIVELNVSTMRLGEHEGRFGYFEAAHLGAGKTRMMFSALDEEGGITTYSERDIDTTGPDSKIYKEIFDNGNSPTPPKPATAEVLDIRGRIYKKLHKSPTTPQDLTRPSRSQRSSFSSAENSNFNATSTSGIGKNSDSSWLLAGFAILTLFFIGGIAMYYRRRRLTRKAHLHE